MDENTALRSFKEDDVAEDPLLVLRCGHVLTRSTMDGYLELHQVYGMDSQGQWAKPLPFQVTQLAGHIQCMCIHSNCLCKSPLELTTAVEHAPHRPQKISTITPCM